MKIQDVHAVTARPEFNVVSTFKPAIRPLAMTMPVGLVRKDLFFGAAKPDEAFRDAQKMADLGGLKEGYIHRIMRGRTDLDEAAGAFDVLTGERAEKMKAYKQVISYAMREVDPARRPPGTEDVMDPGKRHPLVGQVLEEMGIPTLETFQTPIVNNRAIRAANGIPAEVYERLSQIGALTWKVPKAVQGQHIGGHGFDQATYSEALGHLSTMSASIAAAVSATNTIGSGTLKHGTPEQQLKYFKILGNKDSLTAFATTEKDIGTDLNAITTRAKLVEDGGRFYWEIKGNKRFTTNALNASMMIVTAQTDLGGVAPQDVEKLGLHFNDRKVNPDKVGQTAFIVDLPFKISDRPEDTARYLGEVLPGRNIHMKQMNLSTIRGSKQVETVFDGLRIPVENVIGKIGGGKSLAINGLSNGRASVAALALGAAERLIDMSMERAHDSKRKMFGGWQSDMKYFEDRMGFFVTQLAGLRATSEMIASMIAKKGTEVHLGPETALVKVMGTEIAHQIALDVRHLFGGDGFNLEKEFELPFHVEDADIARTIEGANPPMLQAGAGLGSSQFLLNLNSLREYGLNPISNEMGIKGAFKMIGRVVSDRYFSHGNGGLPRSDAKWLKSAAKDLSWTVGRMAVRFGPGLVHQQNANIELGRAQIDYMGIMASMIKLAKYGDQLPANDVDNLKDYVKLTKRSFSTRMSALSKGLPDTKLREGAGKRAIQAYRKDHELKSPLDLKREAKAAKAGEGPGKGSPSGAQADGQGTQSAFPAQPPTPNVGDAKPAKRTSRSWLSLGGLFGGGG
jgi:alkylation response protein AidB-like acyl-CoA dehydrogenase